MEIGGQAVIEGVLMRSPKFISTAVRTPSGKIKVKTERFKSISEKYRFFKLPFIRGVVSMFEMLKIGVKELVYSGNESTDEEEEPLSNTAITITITVSMLFAIGLFVALPYFLTTVIGISEDNNTITFNFIDGIIKICFLIIYIYLISLMKDVKVVFQYHGAEHMAVNCYEDKKELKVENVRKYRTAHPRCGTSFIFIVFFIMLILFSFVPMIVNFLFPWVATLSFFLKKIFMFSIRFLFLMPVIGISYEFLKISSKFHNNPIFKVFVYPGLLIQKLTTNKPNDKQLEVSIAALSEALKAEDRFKLKLKKASN